MTLAELREMPTCLGTGPNGSRIHESVFRSYQMLMKVRQMLMNPEKVPPYVIMEIIDDVMEAPGVDKELGK